MNRSRIEYLDFVYNFYTGCKNYLHPAICGGGAGKGKLPGIEGATFTCYARFKAYRFGRSFEPTFHWDIFNTTMPKEPARIGVCFTGDLFGPWVDPEMVINMIGPEDITLHEGVFSRMLAHPEHRFLLLTKCPENYKKWGEFPDNAWLGATVCNTSMMFKALSGLQYAGAKHRWLSIEPLLEEIRPLPNFKSFGIEWIVIGAQTNPMVLPDMEAVRNILQVARGHDIPVWIKNNLLDHADNELRLLEMAQELPKDLSLTRL